MNTDKELLELAAKAGEIQIDWERYDKDWGFALVRTSTWWNPLADDGDALRLAVKLKMNIDVIEEAAGAGAINYRWFSEPNEGDPYEATRRAIVRAAEESGKNL